MDKKELSAIIAGADAEDLKDLAERIKSAYEVQLVKPPQKTLVMVKAREAVKNSLFYLGEVLATECLVTVNGKAGFCVLLGDDFEKTVDGAVMDGFLNLAQEDRHVDIADAIEQRLNELKDRQQKQRMKMNREILKSKVNFNVMGE